MTTAAATDPVLYYIHDPMCSWCYGLRNTLKQLLADLPTELNYRRLLGGLAEDTDDPMPAGMQTSIRDNWQRIESSIPGVTFNYDFWEQTIPRRSTYMSCRAVIAARQQDASLDVAMTEAIQAAYYQQARNPSDLSTLVELAAELPLDVGEFERAMRSEEVEDRLQQEIELSESMDVYSYPSLRLVIGDEVFPVEIDYNNATAMLHAIRALLA